MMAFMDFSFKKSFPSMTKWLSYCKGVEEATTGKYKEFLDLARELKKAVQHLFKAFRTAW